MTTENASKIEVLQSSDMNDETCQTFVINDEDHTLGNSLRYIVMKNPEVEFCGYSVPHPSENKINFRIQTKGTRAVDALKQGLNDLTDVCGHMLQTFEAKVAEFKDTKMDVQ